MKKKLYDKPTMQVVKLQQQAQLLQSSFTGDRGNPYGEPIDPWDI